MAMINGYPIVPRREMKLYTLDHSPYSTRVRAQIRHKGLPIEFVNPPQLRSEFIKSTFPLGQLPVLRLADGELLGESTVILNYLEDIFPDCPLRGDSALDKARANMMVRWSDNHLAPIVVPIIRSAITQGPNAVKAAINTVLDELLKLNNLITSQPHYRSRDLHIGDICAVVSLSFMQAVFELCHNKSLFDEFPELVSWWRYNLSASEALSFSVGEMLEAIVGWLPVAEALQAYPDDGLITDLLQQDDTV